jgi:hypothetical protein
VCKTNKNKYKTNKNKNFFEEYFPISAEVFLPIFCLPHAMAYVGISACAAYDAKRKIFSGTPKDFKKDSDRKKFQEKVV